MLSNSQMEESNYLLTESQPALDFLMKDPPLQPLTLEEHLSSPRLSMLHTQTVNIFKRESRQGFPHQKYLAPHSEMLTTKQLSQDLYMIAKTKT